MKKFLAGITVAMLTACGGGGGDIPPDPIREACGENKANYTEKTSIPAGSGSVTYVRLRLSGIITMEFYPMSQVKKPSCLQAVLNSVPSGTPVESGTLWF